MSTANIRSWALTSRSPKRNQVSLKKWPIPCMVYIMNLGNLVMSGSEEGMKDD